MSWLPKEWPKTVVMIEQLQMTERGNEFVPIGTAFITECNNVNILVTCKHLIYDHMQKKQIENIYISFNLKNGRRGRRKLEDIKSVTTADWLFHEDESVDLAILPFLIDEKNDDILRMGRNLHESLDNLAEGDDLFFLGFLLGLETGVDVPVRPILRQGMISLIQNEHNFLIEATVFPGNSGSPVFLKPSIINLKTNEPGPIRPAKFIGIINGYISFTDIAISSHTKRPRIVFEENSGLARVIAANRINEIFNSQSFALLMKRLTL